MVSLMSLVAKRPLDRMILKRIQLEMKKKLADDQNVFGVFGEGRPINNYIVILRRTIKRSKGKR